MASTNAPEQDKASSTMLSRFLSLSKKTLLKADDDKIMEFSIKQMVMIHELLLDSLNVDKVTTATPELPDGNNVDNIIEWIKSTFQDEEDVKLASSLFSLPDEGVSSNEEKIEDEEDCEPQSFPSTSTNNTQEKNIETVAIMQYLLRLISKSSNESSTLSGLYYITLPFLLQQSHHQEAINSMIRDALLECTFLVAPSSTNKKEDRQLLQACVNYCISTITESLLTNTKNSTASLFFLVETTSKIFLRLYNVYHENNDSSSIVKHGIHELTILIVRSLCYDTQDNKKTGNKEEEEEQEWIRAIGNNNDASMNILKLTSSMLLPMLYPTGVKEGHGDDDEEDAKRRDEMRGEIRLLIAMQNEGDDEIIPSGNFRRRRGCYWNVVAPTVATSLLCILLPSPSFASVVSSTDTTLWSFIQHLLSQHGNTIIVGREANTPQKTSSFLSSSTTTTDQDDSGTQHGRSVGNEQLLRRRGVYILRHLVELQVAVGKDNVPQEQQQAFLKVVATWKKYILCFEALEMEEETHLVDQTFPTIVELCSDCCSPHLREDASQEGYNLPKITWEWVGSLLARVLLSNSPTIRKLGLFRLLNGDAGVSLLSAATIASNLANREKEKKQQQQQEEENEKKGADVIMSRKKKPSKKHKIKKGNKKGSKAAAKKQAKEEKPPAPISLISPTYFLNVILPSYDSLLQTSVGTNMQYEHEGKIRADDLVSGFTKFVITYVSALIQDEEEQGGANYQEGGKKSLVALLTGLVQRDIILGLRTRTVVQTYNAIATALTTTISSSSAMIVIENDELLKNISLNIRTLWNTGSVVKSMRESLLLDLAKILSKTSILSVKRGESVLGVLGLYENVLPSPTTAVRKSQEEKTEEKVEDDEIGDDEPYHSLRNWLCNIGKQDQQPEQPSLKSQWAQNAGAACASAFVLGMLSPSDGGGTCNDGGDSSDEGFHGCSESEVEIGRAIAKLCTLAIPTTLSSPHKNESSSSELLWPAIHRGLSQPLPSLSSTTAIAALSPAHSMRMERALILLEYGCKEGVLGGMGNGELLIDGKTGQMMTPPPNIESLLKNTVYFLVLQIELVTISGGGGAASASYRSSATKNASSRFARLIGQLRTLHASYPASMEVSKAADELLRKSVDILQNISTSDATPTDVVKHTALVYAVLTCGADPDGGETAVNDDNIKYLLDTCNMLLLLQFELPKSSTYSMKKDMIQTARSLFQYAKWGALSCLLPKIRAKMKYSNSTSCSIESSVKSFYNGVFDATLDAVHATPADALLPLFECALTAADFTTSIEEGSTQPSSLPRKDENCRSAAKMRKILSTLFAVMSEATSNRNRMYMLQQICILIFRPRLLQDEYDEWLEYDDGDVDEGDGVCTPIRSAFRDLIRMAGTNKPHIAKFAISNISVAWLGMGVNDDGKTSTATSGLCAIPYRTDIADMLLYKESKIDQSCVHQDLNTTGWDGAAADGSNDRASQQQDLPPLLNDANDKSIVRGFLLLFLSKLPDPEDGLHQDVLTKFLHFVILRLLRKVSVVASGRGSALMTGSAEYCQKMRAWQALCVLSRFVTSDIASEVCELTFTSMSQNLHGQIRYFIEIFTIQCSRRHPSIFGDAYVSQVRRRDASLQQISSLMIVGGNLIVGRYTVDFFRPSNDGGKLRLNEILAGVLPWLSSTQGFSRAIAQLLVHKLIPLVITIDNSQGVGGSDWFLNSMFQFLEENLEMKRLRRKQTKFFDTYEVDSVCTPGGVLSIPVDESDEANPLHLVEAIKRCLEDVYTEAHENNAPAWKQVDDLLHEEERYEVMEDASVGVEEDETKLVNFQRKILPLDSLHLSMEVVREQSLKNAAGKKKQELIVCATLVDKVPNLAGLARTAEIFAANRLVIPDISVCKMDMFKSVSVSAGDWIKIEECKENSLLQWLKQQKEDGYKIVGLEQTSSSSCISEMDFTGKTVLLLGKEKEGIPVEFLQVADACVEIPQFGIIRSLNVHVTGALAIWEYTKQMMLKQKS